MSVTGEYYRKNSQEFFDSTILADVTPLYDHFLKYVPPNGYILDLGCGSGRDTKAFMDRGYIVDAIDGSEELCSLAGKYTGIEVKCMDFAAIAYEDRYDAIWACASLLHVEYEKLSEMIARLCHSLHLGGILYMSFKYGDFEGIRDGRYFLDMTADRFHGILDHISGCELIEEWNSTDVRREKEVDWYNVILKRVEGVNGVNGDGSV